MPVPGNGIPVSGQANRWCGVASRERHMAYRGRPGFRIAAFPCGFRRRQEHRFRHRQSDTRSRTAEGRYRASLGKPCDVPAKPPRTTARLAQILDIPFPSTVIQPTSPWVHFRCVPRFGSDFLSILRYARDTVVVALWFPLAGGPQRTCTASSHGMRGTIGWVMTHHIVPG